VKYALETLDILITETIIPSKISIAALSNEEIDSYIATANKYKESSRLLLMDEVFNRVTETELELLIDQYQLAIIRLLDTLHNYQQVTSPSVTSNARLYFSISIALEELLGFVEQHFAKYFNLDQKAPDNYLFVVKKQLAEQLTEIEQALPKTDTDQELINIVFPFLFNSFLNNKTDFNTYRQLIYTRELIRELNDLISGNSLCSSIEELLLYLNFNHIGFFKYLIDKLQDAGNQLQTEDAKIDTLKYQRKLLRQMPSKLGFALFFQLQSIKEQVLYWIEEEIIFIESQNKSIDPLPEKKESGQKIESKIIVALSVAQLAFFIRILNLGKIITNNNQSDMIKTFASNFKTYKTEEISYGSLYGKYFKPESSTIRDVKDVLLRLINLINKIKE